MEAEVNSRDYISVREDNHGSGRPNRSPKKVRAPAGRSRSPARAPGPLRHEEGYGVRTSVLQGKVRALKERHLKERHEEPNNEEEGKQPEDAPVTVQLRTYLTEEVLDYSQHGRCCDAQQDGWRSDEFWESYSSEGSSVPCCSGCKMAPLSSPGQDTDSSSVKSQDRMSSSSDNLIDGSPRASKRGSVSISLAERVERNRLDLRSKLGKTAGHPGVAIHGGELDQTPSDKSGGWIITPNDDGVLEVSLPVAEECGELSVRHEQAKQLLQRARMKAKGAAPLRASHCVLPNPHPQQPALHRYSGVLTDGGSLSDSSSSDHCSWQKGSRGSSPSHVRFQDESEREAEERYRERQQVPQTPPGIATPPRKRQSNGLVPHTEQPPPSGHRQCGSCGTLLKGQSTNPASSHSGTNLRSVHLGSKITQDGSVSSPLGVKPSPHWILPSQPWRVHTELIRETHIGGDSTPDSSGEDDGHRTHSKKTRDPRGHKHCRSSTEQGGRLQPSHPSSEDPVKDGKSHSNHHHGSHNGKSSFIEDVGPAARTNCVDSVRTGSRKPTETNLTQKHKKSAPDFGDELHPSDQEIGIGSIVLNVDTIEGKSQTPRTPVLPPGLSSHSPFGHVPTPPSGRASTTVPSRSRLTLRPGVKQQLNNTNEQDTGKTYLDSSSIQSTSVPNIRDSSEETVGSSNNCQPSSQGMKSRKHKSREQPQKPRKHPEDRKATKDSVKDPSSMEQRDNGGPHSSSKQRDHDKHQAYRDQRGKDCAPSDRSREQERGEMHHGKRDEKSTKRSGANGPMTCNNNANTGFENCSRENSFTSQTSSPVIATKGRGPGMADDGLSQPVTKKGDLRSGMKKLLSSMGLASRPKMERFHSTSLEQISSSDHHARSSSADGDKSSDGSPQPGRIKKSPSLQSLKLMSPFHLPRKASSVQNLTGKADRSAAYMTGDVSSAPRRTLSVEDIGSPAEARALGKVAEVFPDGTRLLELQRPDNGTFGFRISSVNGRPDSGIYVQEMSDINTAKLYSGLLRVGDEILELNGTKVSTLGPAQLTELLNRLPVLSLRVLHQRRTQC